MSIKEPLTVTHQENCPIGQFSFSIARLMKHAKSDSLKILGAG